MTDYLIGRIVHYYQTSRAGCAKVLTRDGPYAAMITGIGDEGVWLYIFPEGRASGLFVADGVPFGKAGDAEYWCWPPGELPREEESRYVIDRKTAGGALAEKKP